MSTDFSLIVKLAADTAAFDAGIKTAAQRSRQFAQEAATMFQSTRTRAEQYQMAVQKVTDAYALGRISLEVYQRTLEKLHDEYNQTSATAEKMKQSGERVFREMMTPLERYKAELADLNRLLKTGAINQETFNRAKAAAVTQLSNSGANGQLNSRATEVFNATRTAAERYKSSVSELNGLLAKGRISQDTYNRALKQAQQAYNDASSGGRSLFATIAGGVTVGNLAATAIRSLGRGILSAGEQALHLAADFERAEVAFKTMYRSGELAKDLMVELQRFSAQTPFEFPEIKDAAVKLAGFGVEARQITPTLKMLGDLAAGTGQNIGELAVTYGKARIQGRAFSRDIYEFSNRGIPIQEALAKQFGVTKGEIMGLVEAGQVGFGEIQRALQSLTAEGGQFHNSVEAQSKTLYGLYSTIKDNVNLALAEYGERLAVDFQLTKNAEATIALTKAMKDDLAPALSLVTKDLFDIARAAFDASNIFQHISGMFEENGPGGMALFHEAVVRANLAMAKLQGDTEREIELTNELGKIASNVDKDRFGGGPKPKEESLKLEDNLPNNSVADSIAEFNAKLKEQIDNLGKSADEIELYRLKQQGATDEMLRQTRAMLDQKNAQKELADAQKKAAEEQQRAAKRQADAEKQLIKSLQDRLAALKGLQEENKLARHVAEFGQENVPEEAKRLAREIEAAEALKKKQKEIDDQRKKDAEDAKRIIEASKTPYEKYLEEGNRIIDLYKKGLLTREQAKRAADQLDKEFAEGGKKVEQTSENRALLRGTAEAFSAMNRVNDRRKMEKIAEDHLTVAKRQELLQRQIANGQKNLRRWNRN